MFQCGSYTLISSLGGNVPSIPIRVDEPSNVVPISPHQHTEVSHQLTLKVATLI